MDKIMYDETYMGSEDFKKINPYMRQKMIPLSERYRLMREQSMPSDESINLHINTNNTTPNTTNIVEPPRSEPSEETIKSLKAIANSNNSSHYSHYEESGDNLNHNSVKTQVKPYFIKSNDTSKESN